MPPDWKELKEFAECVGEGWRPIVIGLIHEAESHWKSYEHDMELLREWEQENDFNAGRTRIERLKKKYPINPFENFAIMQVKEKFGGLRFYYHAGNEEFFGAVRFAENLSFLICEWCGSKALEKSDKSFYWIKTLCKECAVKRLEKHNK